jgi:hypothetical protein
LTTGISYEDTYRSIILPFVSYGGEIWPLTLREECRVRMSENRLLRKIFGPKRDDVTGDWGELQSKELHDLYSLSNIVWVIKSRRISWTGHVAHNGEEDRSIQGFGGET